MDLLNGRWPSAVRRVASACLSLCFPLVALLALAVGVRDGHPFAQHRVALDASALSPSELTQVRDRFRHTGEVRLEMARDRERAEQLLKIGMVSAMLSRTRERPAIRVSVGPHDVLFGWGLASVLDRPIELALVQVPRFSYLHFLFPALVLLSISTSTLVGARHAIRGRFRLTTSVSAVGSKRARPTLMAQAVRRVGLGLLQIVLLVFVSTLLFELPLSPLATAWIAAISVAGVLAFSGIGFALACLIEVDSTLLKLALFLQLPLILLSDGVFLLGDLPRPLRLVGEMLPTTYFVRLLRQVLLDGHGSPQSTLLALAVAIVIGVAGFWLGQRVLDSRQRPSVASPA